MKDVSFSTSREEIMKLIVEAGENGINFENVRRKTSYSRSTVDKRLRQLCKEGAIEIIPKYGRTKFYRITGIGKKILDTKDDVIVIYRTDKKLQKELYPDPNEKDLPEILPFNVSIYLSPEVKLVIPYGNRDPQSTKENAKEKKHRYVTQREFIENLSSQMCQFYEILFQKKFEDISYQWFHYELQRMDPSKRKEFLRYNHPESDPNESIDDVESLIMSVKPPEGGLSPLTKETLLSFDGLFIIRLMSEKLKKDSDNILKRLMTYYLNSDAIAMSYFSYILLYAFARLGMITSEEYEEYFRSKSDSERLCIVKNLRSKYGLESKPRFSGIVSQRSFYKN